MAGFYRQFGLMLAALAVAMPAAATVFKYFDKNGNLVLTDRPVKGAVEVPVGPTMTIPAPTGNSAPPSAARKPREAYKVSITSPEKEAIFYRNEDSSVAVAVAVDPALKPGSVLQVTLDGQAYENTEIDVGSLDRGSHNIGAKVINSHGEAVAEAEPVVFYVQQHSAAKSGGGAASGSMAKP